MADRSGYIGRAPGDSSVIIARQTFAPVAITTDFTFASGYTPGYVDVYVDGLRKLVGTDYSATDGSVVSILNGGVSVGSTAVVVAYKAFNVANPISNIGSGSLSVGTDLTVGDIVTINGTTQSSSKDTGAIICEGGVGIEKNLFVGGGAEVTGILTVTNTLDANGAIDVDGHTELDDVNVSGASTFSGAADFNGALDVDGHTELDDLNVSGVGTLTTLKVGATANATISCSDGGGGAYHTMLENSSTGDVLVRGTEFYLQDNANSNQEWIHCLPGAGVELSYADVKKLETTTDGVNVGTAITMYASSGIVSATSFYGDGQYLDNVSASGGGETDITSCLFI